MNKRKWSIGLSAFILIALSLTGYAAIAAEYGGEDDPLVSLSYINDVLSPQVMGEVDTMLEEKQTELEDEIDTKIADAIEDLEDKIAEYEQVVEDGGISDELIDSIADRVIEQIDSGSVGTGSAQAPKWEVLTLSAGQTLTAEVGCEVLLRIGSATAVASSSPGLINLTDATILENGGALATNNLYIVTIAGRGLTTSAGCTILVSGSYTLS